MSRFYAAEAAASEKSSKEKVCTECGNNVPTRCPTCSQYIRAANNEKPCGSCGQEQEDQSEDEWEIKEQKDGTLRALCNVCKRKLEKCPDCERYYDSEEDIDSSDEELDKENEGETDEDEDINTTIDEERADQSKKSYVGRGGKNITSE